MKLNIKKNILKIIAGILVLTLLILGSSIIETNNIQNYQVKQAAFTGEMSVKNDAGTYAQMFGNITTYKKSGEFYFSSEKLDGGDGAEAQPLGASFLGNSTAMVSGFLKYRLPSNREQQLALHENFGNEEAIKMELIRNTVAEAIKQASPLFRPEEAFITRRTEYTEIVGSMLLNGLYATESYTTTEIRDGKEIQEAHTRLKVDSVGNPIITKVSPLNKFGITITQFVIKNFDFDDKTDELIRKKKEAEQVQVVARAEAEKAKQDAITEQAKGAARIATAKADEEVEKIKAVTKAQKDKEVAELQASKEYNVAKLEALQAVEIAKKTVAEGEAQARINKLKVQAGLTPQEQAEWRYKTEVGVASAMFGTAGISGMTWPEIMIIGGEEKNGKVNPFDALGLKALQDLVKKNSSDKQ